MTSSQINNPNEEPNQVQSGISTELVDDELASVSGGFPGIGEIVEKGQQVLEAGADFVSDAQTQGLGEAIDQRIDPLK